jgi:hypothetical protein
MSDTKPVYLPNPSAEQSALNRLEAFKKLLRKVTEHCSTKEDFDLLTGDPLGYALEQVKRSKPELSKLELSAEKIAELAGIPTDNYIKLAYQLAEYPELWQYLKNDLNLDEAAAKQRVITDTKLVLKAEKAEMYREAQKFVDALNAFQAYLDGKGKPNFPWGQLLLKKGKEYEINPAPILSYR